MCVRNDYFSLLSCSINSSITIFPQSSVGERRSYFFALFFSKKNLNIDSKKSIELLQRRNLREPDEIKTNLKQLESSGNYSPMPATVSTRGVLKVSQNRVRTSTALQGSAMWENVIGIVNEERGTNAGVEALINAPQRGGGGGGERKAAKEARRVAAAEAVLATGGFDNTAITSYNELLSLAKSQGAMGEGATRGACKICGQLGHLTKQCRNQFSKFYKGDAATGAAGAPPTTLALPADSGNDSLSSGLSQSSDSSGSSDSSDSEEERRRRRRRKHKERKKKRKHGDEKKKKRRSSSSRKEHRHRDSDDDRREEKHRKSKSDDGGSRHRHKNRSPSEI